MVTAVKKIISLRQPGFSKVPAVGASRDRWKSPAISGASFCISCRVF
jgi:hypothetical protein